MPDLFADEFAGLQRQAEEKRDEAVEKTGKESTEEKRQKRQNHKMIEDLSVLETEVIEPDGVDLSLYRRIGEEVTRVVKHRPGMLYVKEIIRPKYALMSVVCSLLATCKAHDVNPRDYLNDIIARMPYHKKATHEELLTLLPHKWKLQHPESVLSKQTAEYDS